MMGDDLTRPRHQAAALAWCLGLGVPDNGFQDLSLDLNRRHKNKRPTRERLACPDNEFPGKALLRAPDLPRNGGQSLFLFRHLSSQERWDFQIVFAKDTRWR